MVKLNWKIIIPLFYILLSLGYFISVYFVIVIRERIDNIVPIIAGRSTTDMLILFLGVPILIVLLVIIFAKISAVLNFKIMTKLQKNYEYYFVELGIKEFTAKGIFSRALLPVFLSISISLLINSVSFLWSLFGIDPISSIIFLSLILCPITFLLILPIWIFQDSGIIRIRKKSEVRIPPKLTFFGNFQYQSYKGFAGITTPIMYFITMSVYNHGAFNYLSLIIFLYPIFLIGVFMPGLLVYEKQIKKISKKVSNYLNLTPLDINIVSKNFFY